MGDVRVSAPTFLMRAGAMTDQVRAEARRIDPAKIVLTVLFLVPFVVGWLAAQTVRACWAVVSWTWAALVVGWRTAYGRADGGG
jgi:uncharacterized membrane protein